MALDDLIIIVIIIVIMMQSCSPPGQALSDDGHYSGDAVTEEHCSTHVKAMTEESIM